MNASLVAIYDQLTGNIENSHEISNTTRHVVPLSFPINRQFEGLPRDSFERHFAVFFQEISGPA
jgi:hypothetical protein